MLKKLYILIFVCYAASNLAAQENENIIYYIKNIDISIEGRTRQTAVLRAGNFVIGEELQSKIKLEQYIADKTQMLLNNRTLSEAAIEYSIENEDNGRCAVSLFIRTVDTRNFIILPEPKYSSNAGFEPAIKLRDYNFLGAMTPLKIDLGYTLDEFHIDDSSKGKYSVTAESYVPFRAAGFDWNLKLALGLAYVAGESLAFENITGIAINVPYKKTMLTFGFDEGIIIKEEYYLFDKQKHSNIFEDISYMYSMPFARWFIPLGIRHPLFGELFFTSELSGKINYRFAGGDLDWRHGPLLSFDNMLGFNRIDWIGNFRKGYLINLNANFQYNIYFDQWNNNISLLGTAHTLISSFGGFSARIRYKTWFNDAENFRDKDRAEAGNMLRGILDRSIYADSMFSFNFDLPFRVLKFLPSEWLNTQKLRYFNFEMHLAPILDMAFVNGSLYDYYGKLIDDLSFGFADMFVTGGIEVLVFPLAWRSIFLRFSIAWNLREAFRYGSLPSGINREIFIGIGYHY